MNKRNKTIVAIFVVLFLIVGSIVVFRMQVKKDYDNQDNTEITEGNDTENSAENTDEQEQEVQVQLVENEGDLEIIIPEDMESDGF